MSVGGLLLVTNPVVGQSRNYAQIKSDRSGGVGTIAFWCYMMNISCITQSKLQGNTGFVHQLVHQGLGRL